MLWVHMVYTVSQSCTICRTQGWGFRSERTDDQDMALGFWRALV